MRNVDGIRKRKFSLLKCLLANGGHGFDCLSETVYSYLCYGLCSGKIVSKVDDIADDLIKEHLLKVCDYIITMCIENGNRRARGLCSCGIYVATHHQVMYGITIVANEIFFSYL